ncbi:MAG: tetratricopeptide repeat protein [Acidobacteria bacterium]|nr:tetratricopeptide repeat protein [Acidobacteriota bacterium]
MYPVYLAAALSISCGHHARTAASRGSTLPPPQPVFERQIRNALDAGEGDLEVRALRRRLAAEPDNLKVRLDLAAAYAQRGYPDLALEHARLAASRFPDSADAVIALAKGMRAMNQRREAAATLDAFIRSHPTWAPETFSWLGIVRDEMGQWKEGEKWHRAALERAPKSAYLHNNLGYNLFLQGRREEAAQEFRAALEANPNYTLARNNLGLALANHSEQAIGELRRANDPASAHNNLAAALMEQGRYEEARKELETALGYNKLHPAALNNLRLLTGLDGKPATLRAGQAETRWQRWKAGLRSLFVGPLPGEPRKQAETAKGSS